MAGGKGKSTGGKAGPKESPAHKQKSHSAKAGLQVSTTCVSLLISSFCQRVAHCRLHDSSQIRSVALSPPDTMSQTARNAFKPRYMDVKGVPKLIAQSALGFNEACRSALPFLVYIHISETTTDSPCLLNQFPCGRVKRFLKNNTQNKMRVGAKGMYQCISQ